LRRETRRNFMDAETVKEKQGVLKNEIKDLEGDYWTLYTVNYDQNLMAVIANLKSAFVIHQPNALLNFFHYQSSVLASFS